MNLSKTMTAMVSTAALMAVASSAAMAQQITFASASGSGAPADQSVVFTYTGGANGQFTTSPGAIFLASSYPASDPGAILSFTGFQATAPVTGSGTAGDPFQQSLGGGSFSLKSSGGADLLDGTFTGGNLLSAIATSTTSSITNTVNNLTYTGGSYFVNSGLANPGSFSISMTSVAPAPTVTDGYLDSFTAGGTSTFSASKAPTAVPEPATVVPFAMGGLALLGLIARKTRRASAASA